MTRKQIPISQIKCGAIRHEQLSSSLTARINYLCQALDEVYSQPIEKWIDEFQRDADPESEVVWWERLTRCYLAYTQPKDLSFKQKQATFKILFTLGMGGDVHALISELSCLPEGAREDFMGLTGKAVH